MPGIVRVHDHGVADGRGWLAMDRHDVTLAERLASTGPLSSGEVIAILGDCCDALEALHAADMLHRDIKPSNVFLGSDGRAVLADLGVVQFTGEATLTGMTPLSLQWAAPETIETGESSVATDIYSLGTTAFTLLQGRPPFDLSASDDSTDGSTIAVGPALRLIAAGERGDLGDQVPAPLRDLIDEMIDVDPGRRPSSAVEVRRRLGALRHDATTAVLPASRSGRPTRSLVVVMLGLLVVGLLGVAAWFGLTSGGGADDATSTQLADVPANAVSANDVSASGCDGGAIWCEPLSLDTWRLNGDPAITSFDEIETERGPGLLLTPGPATDGGHVLERSLEGLEATDRMTLRFEMLVADVPPGATEDRRWFQSVATISDETTKQWNVNLIGQPDGLYFNTGFAVDDVSGGSSALAPHPTGVWHCVELTLAEAGPVPVELRVNGEVVVELPDEAAADRGDGLLLGFGPRWLESADLAPNITIADAAISKGSLGC